ncbi:MULTISPECIES: ABC transporter ATP-binding protein [Lysobacter]|uniref:ABC transporter ATP-binding protein n=1 Tax=Lysobacter firmicutimachus TaxID=1792846 RepID=A0ABU8CYW2_9GAMM|nr:ABC transporter ATP-binding protein [Lysobacter antibioticus]
MNGGALQVHRLGKAYRHWRSEWLRVASWFGLYTGVADEHWVLRDVSFSVAPGESVGIVGQNGAGKSTLLKLVTGTSRPTEGAVGVQGRVAAILELGMGFNPDLTGRQNAFHSAGLMGYSESQIAAVMPEIERFAEIGEYFDEPARTYSSGMQMRVAFSVATAIRPDVLIVDEALSVGDAYFVHKSFQRIREFREAGTTLLIVSHDAVAIQSMCDRAVLLDAGRLVLDGPPQEVFDYYNAMIADKENASIRIEASQGHVATHSGSGEAVFESVGLFDAQGQPVEFVEVGAPLTLQARVRANEKIPRLIFGYMLRDRLGQPIYGTNTDHTAQPVEGLREGDEIVFRVCFQADLGVGSYSISVALSSTETHLVKNYEWRDMAVLFTVANAAKPRFVGLAYLPASIEVQHKHGA